MNDISFRKCYDALKRSNPNTAGATRSGAAGGGGGGGIQRGVR
jgi:hypothetical protein